MALARIRVTWAGSMVIGPGVSTFYTRNAPTNLPMHLLAFFTSLATRCATGITFTVPNNGDLIDEGSGALTGVWTDIGGGTVASSGGNPAALGVGGRIVWATNGIYRGRRVRGTTFVCPLGQASFLSSGNLAPAYATVVLGAANTLITAQAGTLEVYSRPQPGSAGQGSSIIAPTVPLQVSWLRSRRT